ncbi:MAG: hypothetical protein UT32_C0001G0132 [Parcubacteria group bacterium GW2011_GWC2_39_14]|nr:MAG: hypothetical protein UT32_C0001G0132 [Parcubacteria group bacterium GW2011_GWC2_39_14]KKR55556.1 MAG: hypothetical protein UT91_C0001G0131 [Parcubacteria group bacterium GW2011_GWA2_40_23]
MRKITKHFLRLGIILIVLFVLIVAAWVIFYFHSFAQDNFKLGVNFSKSYTEYLGLNWQQTYTAILDDLKVKNIRLAAPWNEIEPIEDHWVFTDLDWQVNEAVKRNVDIILVLGRRTPHWPECHDPVWLMGLPPEIIIDRQNKMMTKVIEHYKNISQIKIWQVENEPLLDVFGVCPPGDINLLRQEVTLVKNLDDRPVLITDSGELSFWAAAANTGDIFGTTMYRVTHNPYLGYLYYHLPPAFYTVKAKLAGKNLNDVIVSELQAEPWAPGGLLNTSLEEQQVSMDGIRLVNHVNYAKRTGFVGAYLWGAEWWYWLREKQGVNELWDTAQKIFK